MTAHLKEDEAERAHQIATKYAHATMVDACEAEIVAAIVRIAEEREEAREALKVMHRRAQSAEGQAEAARYDLNMWSGHPVMKTVGGYLASEVAKSGLKALNRRRALSQQPDKEGT